MATIEQRGSSFRVQWRLGGRRAGARQSASFTGPKLEAAHQLAVAAQQLVESRGHRMTREEVLEAVLGVEEIPAGQPTLEHWVKLWAEERAPVYPDHPGGDELQADTLEEYLRVMRLRVLPYLGHKYLSEIDEDAVREWVRALKATRVRRTARNPGGHPISPQTVRKAHAVLHQVLGAAVPRLIPRNPAARPAGSRKNRVGLPKVVPFEGMFLTPQEVDAIHGRCAPAIADLWFVLVRTGLRLGEAVVLRVQDVTVEGARPEIRVRRALKKGQRIGLPKSAKSRRDVEVSAEVAKVLRERCKGKRPKDLIFPSPGGKVWRENNLRRRYWLPAVAEAQRCLEHPPPAPPKPRSGPTRRWRPDEVSTCGCPGLLRRTPRLHDARHTHASTLIHQRWLPIEVQHRLGHASYQTTMNIYGHLWRGGNADRLDLLDRRLALQDDEEG